MPLTERRPSLYLLSLPHPPLSCAKTQSTSKSPITPRNSPPRDSTSSRPRSSTDSWNSVKSTDNDVDVDWSLHQINILSKHLENIEPTVSTPYHGVIPPSNVLDKVARRVKQTQAAEWPQSIRQTRLKLLHLARQKNTSQLGDVQEDSVTLSIKHSAKSVSLFPSPLSSPAGVPTQSTRAPSIKKPMYRIPAPSVKSNVNITRAASRLHRSERLFMFHPYASSRPASRSPSPPVSDDETLDLPPKFRAVSGPLPLRRTSSSGGIPKLTIITTLAPPAPVLRSAISISPHPLSQCLTVEEIPATITHRTSNPCIARIRHSESFTRPTSMGPTVFSSWNPPVPGNVNSQPRLKRAPSYGAANQQAKAVAKQEKLKSQDMIVIKTPNRSGGESSSEDEEERHRQKTIKRVKTMHRKPSYIGAELPKLKTPVSSSLESLLGAPSLCSSPSVSTMSSAASSDSAPSYRTPTKRGRSKPKSPEPTPLPKSSSPPESPKTRTLRRVGVRKLSMEEDIVPGELTPTETLVRPSLASLGQLGRKISFNSLEVPRGGRIASMQMLANREPESLFSPFEDKPLNLVNGNAKRATKYLF